MRARFLAVIVAVLVPAGVASAGGAGGVAFGAQYYDPGLSNGNHSFTYITGFGYGTSGVPSGRRFGGFGMAIIAADGTTAGGVGGMLLGHEFHSGPLVAGLTLSYGVGGISYNDAGYLVLFGEGEFELGVTLPWMQLTAYAGFQAWGNLVPGFPLRNAVAYTPVLGVRMAWGSF